MPNVIDVMAEALKDAIIDAEGGGDITFDTYEKMKYALDLYKRTWVEETIHGVVEEGC